MSKGLPPPEAMRTGTNQIQVDFREIDGWLLGWMPADGFFDHVPTELPVMISETCYPMPGDLLSSMPSTGTLSTHFDPYHFLAQVVYLISNNLHITDYSYGNEKEHLAMLNTLAHQVHQSVVFSIFKTSTPSIRAVWEWLFRTAAKHKVRDGLILLITIALRFHPEWVDDDNNELLVAAVSIGDAALVQQLLDRNANPTIWHVSTTRSESGWSSGRTIFGIAAACNATDCAEIIIKKCGIEKITTPSHDYSYRNSHFAPEFGPQSSSVFVLFILEVCLAFKAHHDTQSSTDANSESHPAAYLEIFSLLLEAGANIDAAVPWVKLRRSSDVQLWKTSCLEACFYFHRSMFDLALPYSRIVKTTVTRAGVCESILQGKDALTDYLESVLTPFAMDTRQCLEATLGDQFSMSRLRHSSYRRDRDKKRGLQIMSLTEVRVARALIEYGIPILAWIPDWDWDANEVLQLIVVTADCHGLNEDLVFLLDQLLQAGAFISSDSIQYCIARKGTEVLEALLQRDARIDEHGGEALFFAAEQNNYDAVSLLLDVGVDINSELGKRGGAYTCCPETVLSLLLTNCSDSWSSDFDHCRTKMWKFFVCKGAKLRLHRGNTTCLPLLRSIIQMSSYDPSAWEAFSFILHFDETVDQLSPLKWQDLLVRSVGRKCDRRIIESLIRRSGHISQPILAMIIAASCESQLVEQLVAAGQGVNDYSGDLTPVQAAAGNLDYKLVCRLLLLGANINSPARGRRGGTALQIACAQSTSCHPDRMHQKKCLIRLMVTEGADINAPACIAHSTPLQSLCAHSAGTREEANHLHQLIIYLIQNGADINAAAVLGFSVLVNVSRHHLGNTALQHCARLGDLETAVILVKHGVDPNIHPAVGLDQTTLPHRIIMQSALDLAAERGRLDMTQYLLNIGALSANPGATGYQGAIDAAVAKKHHAVAEIIRSYIEKVAERVRGYPLMLANHEIRLESHAVAMQRRKDELKEVLGFEIHSYELDD